MTQNRFDRIVLGDDGCIDLISLETFSLTVLNTNGYEK